MTRFSTLIAIALVHSAVALQPRHLSLSVDLEETTVDESSQLLFDEFIIKHGRSFEKDTPGYEERLSLFSRRVHAVHAHNTKRNRRWTAAVNHLSDWTEEELSQLCGYRPSAATARAVDKSASFRSMISLRPVGDSKDYLSYENVQFIRDQGMCGSCWAVAATTVLSAHAEIAGINHTFSTQEIVDCVPNPHHCGGSGGCNGATVELAFQYVAMRGSQQPSEYGSYIAKDASCKQPVSDEKELSAILDFAGGPGVFSLEQGLGRTVGMQSWERLPSNKERPLVEALYHRGPLAVSLAANDLFFYGKGIFDGCEDFVVNHAVTLVGFGHETNEKQKKEKHWLVQNSWGPGWGESGRVRILRRDDEEAHCGMDEQPQEGIACEGETEPVEVCGTCGILYDSVMPHFAPVKS